MNNVFITAKKELRAIFRDKKFLSIIFFMPLIIPCFILGYGALYDSMERTDGYKIGIDYQMNDAEKNIMETIGSGIEIVEKDTNDLTNAYNDKEIDAYIIKEDNTYNVYVDSSSTSGITVQSIINTYLEQYNNYLGNEYLINNNINPENVFGNIKVESHELSVDGNDYFSNFIISFALIYLVMIITITAMNTSTDIIAGEKERGTFETLLTFPLKSNEIIGGKLLAIVSSCVVSSLIGVATSIPALMYIKDNSETFSKLNISINVTTIILSIVTLILISAMVGVISIFLCGKAKTFKEAQSKISFLSFVSIIPIFTNMMDVSSDVMYLLPIANGGTVLNDLFLGGITVHNMLLFVVSSIVVTLVALLYVSRQYKDESALF